jgi:hypothetical protein
MMLHQQISIITAGNTGRVTTMHAMYDVCRIYIFTSASDYLTCIDSLL